MINIEVIPGVGAPESLDFRDKLVHMYSNFLKNRKIKFSVHNPEYNKKIIIIESENDIVFKLLSKEPGVHRLVRVSPFDEQKRRHTSFCSVQVYNVDNKLDEIDVPVRSYILDPYKAVTVMGSELTDKVEEVLDGKLELIGVGNGA